MRFAAEVEIDGRAVRTNAPAVAGKQLRFGELRRRASVGGVDQLYKAGRRDLIIGALCVSAWLAAGLGWTVIAYLLRDSASGLAIVAMEYALFAYGLFRVGRGMVRLIRHRRRGDRLAAQHPRIE